MTIKELKEIIKDMDDNLIIIMSSDAEGNNYSPLSGASDSYNYLADTTWSGEVGYKKLTQELIDKGYGEEDILDQEPNVVPCVLFWPIN